MFWHKKKEVLSLEIASYDCTYVEVALIDVGAMC